MKQEELHFQTIVIWLLDLAAVTLSVTAAFKLLSIVPGAAYTSSWLIAFRMAACLIYSFLFFWNINTAIPSGEEKTRRIARNLVWKSLFLLIFLLIFTAATAPGGKRSIGALFTSLFALLLILIFRIAYTRIFIRQFRSRGFGARMVLVTEKSRLKNALHDISSDDVWQLHLAGVVLVDAEPEEDVTLPKGAVRLMPRELDEYIGREPVAHVIFNLSYAMQEKYRDLIKTIRDDGIGVILPTDPAREVVPIDGASYGSIRKNYYIFLNNRKMRERTQCVKRIIDLIAAVFGTLITLLLCIVLAPAIKLNSKGPVFLKETCVGKDGMRYQRMRFRTTYYGAELKKTMIARRAETAEDRKNDPDPEITSLGRIIKKLHLEDLPYFFSLLKGDISLVGVNTITEEEYKGNEHMYRKCLWCKPGMITPGVSPLEENAEAGDTLAADIAYAQNWSLWIDAVTVMDNLRIRYEKSHQSASE